VQALRDNPTLSKRELNLLWDVPSQVEKAILTLLDDGLIEEQRKGTFSLPQ
jgi:A/G-specific adenine glycosylase